MRKGYNTNKNNNNLKIKHEKIRKLVFILVVLTAVLKSLKLLIKMN